MKGRYTLSKSPFCRCGALALLLLFASKLGATEVVPSIYVVRHGWHAGIVIEQYRVAKQIKQIGDDFARREFVEIGWGDRGFYQTMEPRLGDILKAGMWPTESVLHVVGFDGSVTRYFPQSEIIRINLTEQGIDDLVAHIATGFEEVQVDKSPDIGLYGDSRFYHYKESYHIFNTCNIWTARALRSAGLQIDPAAAITVPDLLQQLYRVGEGVQTGVQDNG